MTTITKTNSMKAVEGLVRDLEFSRRHNESEEVKGLSLCYITRQMRPYVMRAREQFCAIKLHHIVCVVELQFFTVA